MNESSSDEECVVANDGDGDGSERSDGDTNITNPSLEYNYQYVPIPPSFTAEQLERISVIEAAASNVQGVLEKYGNASTLPPTLDPNDVVDNGWKIDPRSPWADTPSAINEIVAAGRRMVRAWSSSSSKHNDDENEGSGDTAPMFEPQKEWWQSILSDDNPLNNSNESSSESISKKCGDVATSGISPMDEPFTEEEQHQFHDVYMEWATNAFEEELDALRKGQLESFTSSRRKTKNTITITTTANTNTMRANTASSSVELDSTQYSFVVATNNNRDDNRNGVNGNTDAALAEAARIASIKEIDVRVLSDMLCSGSNVLSQSEKRMLLQARQRAILKDAVAMEVEDTDVTTELTLHERRKREIGLC